MIKLTKTKNNKEAYNMTPEEMEGAHRLPRDAISTTNYLQQVLYFIGKRSIVDEIKPK